MNKTLLKTGGGGGVDIELSCTLIPKVYNFVVLFRWIIDFLWSISRKSGKL